MVLYYDFIERPGTYTHKVPKYNVFKYDSPYINHLYIRFECDITILGNMYHFSPILSVKGITFTLSAMKYTIANDTAPLSVYLLNSTINNALPITCRATMFTDGSLGVTIPEGVRGTYTLTIFGYMEKYQ